MSDFWNVPLTDERTMSIRQFCLAEDMSEDELYALACQGRAPKLTTADGDFYAVRRITSDARREWHKFISEGFPIGHREDVLLDYFPDDGRAWREGKRAEFQIDHDDWAPAEAKEG